ncbi:MAG: CDP-diacylglycerol--serine O-phosphatidyltransferase [Candidatus Dasytiphilus stammeri]
MIWPKFKKNRHQQHLTQLAKLPKLSQQVEQIKILYKPQDLRKILLEQITQATRSICIVALFIEDDDGGKEVLSALYTAKKIRPYLDISIFVDWHRAHRSRIGTNIKNNNADLYYELALKNPASFIPIYGVPINIREALGVLHFKGFIVDDFLIYSGASLNNLYLHKDRKYRYDRYYIIQNSKLTNTMFTWIQTNFKLAKAVHIISNSTSPNNYKISRFRSKLRNTNYQLEGNAGNQELAVTPLVGLGKRSLLNKTISNLMQSTKYKLTLCTPYFNLPTPLGESIITLLREGKQVEIIVGDKTANDFYIPDHEPFKLMGTLPYLYEINLRSFLRRLQYYVNNGQLTIRIWKKYENSYHLKGIWVDKEWMLITGHNFNPRAWKLDLENALLIHDPKHQLVFQRDHELEKIRKNTFIITHFSEVESIIDYPLQIRELIRFMRRIHLDKLINRLI